MADPCAPSPAPVPSYGSIASSAPSAASRSEVDPLIGSSQPLAADEVSFDANQTYYLKPNTRWTRRKIWATTVPILAACIVMGGIAYFLLRDFGHLYPGRGGDRSPFYSNGGMSPVTEKEESESSVSKASNGVENFPSKRTGSRSSGTAGTSKHNEDTTLDAGANCAVHPDCSKLAGDCCPTSDGHMLVCCNF
jgi:hypothetical protein